VQRLHPAAGADVQGAVDRAVDDQLGQGGGRVARADHVVAAGDGPGARAHLGVGDHEAGPAVLQVPRSEVDQGADDGPVGSLLDGDEPRLGQFVHGKDGPRGPRGDGRAEPPQAQQQSEPFLPAGGAQGGHQLFTGQGSGGGVAEPVADA
jgi:hypothetical protein